MKELLEAAKAVIDGWDNYGGTTLAKIHLLRAAVERAESDTQTETELFTYVKGYEGGKQYVTNRVKRVLEGKPVPASTSIDCGLFEIKDKTTVTNLNLADGIYRLLAIREQQ